MGKPKSPAPPDPKATAAAQTGTNVSTAVANAMLNNVDQITPDGSLTYRQRGGGGGGGANPELLAMRDKLQHSVDTFGNPELRQGAAQRLAEVEKKIKASGGGPGGEFYNFTDPASGQTFKLPLMEAVQTLSPAQQRTKAASDAAQTNLARTAQDQSAFLQDYLGEPADLTNEATEGRLIELGRRRLDPILDERRDALRTDLVNRGIREGSEAHERATRRQGEAESDAYTSLLLGGRDQAFREAAAARNQPINEITALLSGSQVSAPQPLPVQGAGIPTVDFAGLTQQDFANQMGAYGQKMNSRNQLMGGLFGLGAGALAGGYI